MEFNTEQYNNSLEKAVRDRTAELTYERNRLKRIFSTTSEGLVVVKRSGLIDECNEAFQRLVGEVGSLGGDNIYTMLFNGEGTLEGIVADTISSGVSSEGHKLSLKNREGKEVPVIVNAAPFPINGDKYPKVLLTITDITDIVDYENRMIRAETLAVVGNLAAGAAHEFNNINAIIRGNLDLLLTEEAFLPPDAVEQLKVVRKMVSRSADITNNLLAFSKGNGSEKNCIPISQVVNDSLKLIEKEFRTLGIKIYRGNMPDDLFVMGNSSQLSQVFMNVFLNAQHAMLETVDKQLHVDIEQSGGAIHVRVSDTGIGIPEEDIPYLFNPFFTTKGEFAPSGSPSSKVKGTGLGLSVSHTIIVKHHGGDILVDSQSGEGTTFVIVLPLVMRPKNAKLISSEKQKIKREEIRRGNMQRVLVLDDEKEIGKILEVVLKGNGYEPLCLLEGKEALELHQEKPFDIVIVDLQMPDMTGQVFLEALNDLPNVPKKIVLTGLAHIGDELEKLGVSSIVRKPFDIENVLLAIQKCVAGEE